MAYTRSCRESGLQTRQVLSHGFHVAYARVEYTTGRRISIVTGMKKKLLWSRIGVKRWWSSLSRLESLIALARSNHEAFIIIYTWGHRRLQKRRFDSLRKIPDPCYTGSLIWFTDVHCVWSYTEVAGATDACAYNWYQATFPLPAAWVRGYSRLKVYEEVSTVRGFHLLRFVYDSEWPLRTSPSSRPLD